jgi:two-component system, OmpR family, phosphate regulon response regulator PhoB
MSSILIVEDESPVREMLRFALSDEGYTILEAADASEAFVLLKDKRPDLILLDWMLPGMSGMDFARRLRRDPSIRGIPVIFLTARAEEDDMIRGLQQADDYITKPFSTRELKARIETVLRRAVPDQNLDYIESGSLCMDTVSHKVTAHGVTLSLGPIEFRLLRFFMSNPERVYSREQILDQVWGRSAYIEERTVDVHIRRLRKSLAPHGYDRHIQTVRTVGYRFSPQP